MTTEDSRQKSSQRRNEYKELLEIGSKIGLLFKFNYTFFDSDEQ